ncbi:MAG: response regulator [Caldicoprobacter sp.]|uniref:response regulator n=1 Tax=Caldicoprobacter sp. TaxID=2004500 RepID=UPI0039C1CA6B
MKAMVLRVMMVDSSYEARRDIDSKIRWVENDFELVGEANNGEEALALLPHVSPHVIFTEIRMPKMDGITFIETAKKRWPDIKYVIVSNYDNFEYLRQAMRVGAYDYILKPVKVEEINQVLLRAKFELETGMRKFF